MNVLSKVGSIRFIVTGLTETLANQLRKPLFALSEVDLKLWGKIAGVSNDNALQYAFKWAHRWRALMFFDEADNLIIRNPNWTSDLFTGKLDVEKS